MPAFLNFIKFYQIFLFLSTFFHHFTFSSLNAVVVGELFDYSKIGVFRFYVQRVANQWLQDGGRKKKGKNFLSLFVRNPVTDPRSQAQ